MADRAASELVGFVLVFALVLATMSLVTATSLGEFRDVRDAERTNNAERGFDVLADNVAALVEEDVPSQATEISLAAAELSFGDPVDITVSGANASDPDDDFSYTYTVRPLVYDGGSDGRVVYVAGATIRAGRSSSVMTREPSLVLSPQRSNVLVVQTRQSAQPSAVGGSSTVLVRTERVDADLYRVNRTTYDLSIEVDSPRADAWERYLSRQPGTTCGSPGGGSVTCSLTTDRLYVTVVRINVVLEPATGG